MNRRLAHNELIVWRLLDGRAGHENQVHGLSEAIGLRQPSRSFDVKITSKQRGLRSLTPGCFGDLKNLPHPDLIIAAGHATHVPLLRLQHQYGGRSVVIMKPSLPMMLFDACLIPSHDEVTRPPANAIVTEGAVNRIRPENRRTPDCGVILVGGPSKHFRWSDEMIVSQIRRVVECSPMPHVVATSQRTPESFRFALMRSGLDLPIKESSEFDSAWIANTLSHSESIWVTCDSMSMIYEAITCGANVGLLELPVARNGRLHRNIERLSDQGLATRWSDWSIGHPLRSQTRFCEADRCAEMLLERFDLCDIPDAASTGTRSRSKLDWAITH